MTASISSLRAGEDMLIAQPAPRAAPPRTNEWDSLYQRQLRQRNQVALQTQGSGERDSNPASGRHTDSERDPKHPRAVVVPVGGHLELQLTTRATSAMLEVLSAQALTSGAASEGVGSGAVLESNSPATFAAPLAGRHRSIAGGTTGDAWGTGVPGAWAPRGTAGQNAAQRGNRGNEGSPSVTGAVLAGSFACALASQPRHAREAPRPRYPKVAAPTASVLNLAASQGLIAPGSATGTWQDSRQSAHDRQQPGIGGNAETEIASAIQPGRSYGTFPLIVSDQLLELEFVSLACGRGPAPGIAQQIVMSIQPPGMSRIELTARKLDGKVAVTLGGVADGRENCAVDGMLDLSALLRRIGWGSLPVELTAEPVVTIGIGALQ